MGHRQLSGTSALPPFLFDHGAPFFRSAYSILVRPRGRQSSAPTADMSRHRAQRRSMTALSWGRPKGLSLTAASTAAGLVVAGRKSRPLRLIPPHKIVTMSLPSPPFSTRSRFRRRYVPNALSTGTERIAQSSGPVPMQQYREFTCDRHGAFLGPGTRLVHAMSRTHPWCAVGSSGGQGRHFFLAAGGP
jgi:hypothetical protein